MNPAVAIFVKTPGYSDVKTRLSVGMGKDFAEKWHRRAAAAVAASATESGLPAYWAVAETAALNGDHWPELPNLDQGTGSLGARMARVHRLLVERHGAGILVGSDMPQLTAGQLRRAAALLESDRPAQVIGPAVDGGFWLFGANRCFPESDWTAVTYSQPDTAARFCQVLAPEARWHTLEPQTDLDRPSDLAGVLAELRALSAPTLAQRRLAEWLGRPDGPGGRVDSPG